ncbi:MAG: hypothetical protein K6F69_03920 [Treponema sp.]|nr:hypothetical protein [Treponema sp.]
MNCMSEEEVNVIRKKNPLVVFVKTVLFIIVFLLLLLVAWAAFCCFDKKTSLSALPREYSLYVHLDSAWDSLSPMIDMNAGDEILAMEQFKPYRAIVMNLRSSIHDGKTSRYIPFLSKFLKRKVELALYGEGDKQNFLAVVDTGILAACTRLSPVAAPFIKVEGLSYVTTGGESYFEFKDKETSLYIKTFKNLVLASDNKDILIKAYSVNNAESYTEEQLAVFNKKSEQSVRVFADSKKLAESLTQGDALLEACLALLPEDDLSEVNLSVNDSDINIKATFPYKIPSDANNALATILGRKSSVPGLLSAMSEDVQYYTMLNIGSLKELKEAAFPYLNTVQNVDDLWSKADSASKILFSYSIDDLVFSWSGKEFAALGIKGYNDPVFAVQVSDENKRKEVFDKILDTIFLTSDDTLIMDGVHLTQIGLPNFLQNLLAVFGVKIPSPYYMVHEGFLYLSESPETLATIYRSQKAGRKLASNFNWNKVSETHSPSTAISVFYDLERSVPFFIRSNSDISKVLRMYSIGRCDIRFENSMIVMQIQACANKNDYMRVAAGFPMNLSGKTNGFKLLKNGKDHIIWTEDQKKVCSLDQKSLSVITREFAENISLVSSDNFIWAVTDNGTVYLMNEKLEDMEGFPVYLAEPVSAEVTANGDSVIIPMTSNRLVTVHSNGNKESLSLSVTGSIKSSPAVYTGLDDKSTVIALYDKSFLGKIILIKNGSVTNSDMSVPGIGYGSPALLGKKNLYTAFITQAGYFYLWKDGLLVEDFPMKFDGIYNSNVVAISDNTFAAVSDSAVVFKVTIKENDIEVTSGDFLATNYKTDKISTVNDYQFLSTQGNLLYAYKNRFENLVNGFPKTGVGTPVFADVDYDGKDELFILTLDNKLFAWKIGELGE